MFVCVLFISGQYIGIQMKKSTYLMILLVQLIPKLEDISLTGVYNIISPIKVTLCIHN